MSMIFIPLCSNLTEKLTGDEIEVRDQQLLSHRNGEADEKVPLYVDFTEYEASEELKGMVLARIDSLKQYYKDKKTMHSIEEE